MKLAAWHASHPGEETLELYALHQLDSQSESKLEEHLLVCHSCQDSLEEIDLYIRAMKSSLDAFPRKQARRSRTRLPGWQRVSEWFQNAQLTPNRLAWAGGLAVACLSVAIVAPTWTTPATPTAVTLSAFRGDPATTAHLQAGPLDLTIQASDLSASGAYSLEIVNARGAEVWSGPATTAEAGKLSALVPENLKPGSYWVRLYTDEGELLREFGLQLE